MPPLNYPGTMASPPIPPPPDAPSLSAFATGAAGPAGLEQSGGLAKLFFGVEQALDSIAAGAPGAAMQLDSIKQQLRAVLTSILRSGAGGMPDTTYGGPPGLAGAGGEPIR